MLALELRARAEPDREKELIAQALKSYGQADDQTAAALGAWLFTRGHFDVILKMLPLERADRSRDLLVERIDAMAALGQLKDLKEMLLTEHPVLPQTYQHMYLAVVDMRSDEVAATSDEWQRALETAGTTDTLLALAEYAQKNDQLEIVDQALDRAIIKQPGLRSAYAWRLRVLENIGPTATAHHVAEEIVRLWSNDIETRIHEIYLRLLINNSPSEAASAESDLKSLAARIPPNGVLRSAIALAKLRQGQATAALEELGASSSATPPGNVSWPVYVAALSATGWKEKAREQSEKLATTRLLPEERALIAPFVSQSQ
jgi:hypothetical protein